MNKKFCDICGEEIKENDKKSVFENNIYIRLGRNDDLFEISDLCNDCIIEFMSTFSKFIKEKEQGKK